ncbi:MAG: hypothetical protein EON48_17960, partial [Acetobacteraceae bacterium]
MADAGAAFVPARADARNPVPAPTDARDSVPARADAQNNGTAGHRTRLRDRFLQGGTDAMPDYELLEL